MEKLLNEVGPFGKYQKLILILCGFVSSLTATTIFSTIFSTADPGLVCSFKNDTNEIKNLEKPCEIWSTIKESKRLNQTCDYECKFSDKYYGMTMVTEWELICDKSYLVGLTQTAYMVGTVSGLFIGYLSDKYGRKRSTFVMILLLTLVLAISELTQLKIFGLSLQTVYVIYIIGQILIGALSKGIYVVNYILVLELTTAKYSTLVTNIILYMYVMGEMFVLAIAYVFKDWHALNIFMIGYSLLLMLIIGLLMPESPRYLISKRLSARAIKLLRKIHSINYQKVQQMENDLFENFLKEEIVEEEQELENSQRKKSTSSFDGLWKPRSTFFKTISFIYIWFSLSMLYYGISLGITSLDGDLNPYLMYLLSSIAEVVGYILCHLNDRFGRKQMMIIFMIISSIMCIIVALIPASTNSLHSLPWNSILMIISASVGKAFASSAFNSCYVLNSIVYPTSVRITALMFTVNIGAIGAFISPQINSLRFLVWQPLPYLIFGSCSFLATIFIYLLPDPSKINFD